jgi:hypothetical protein
LSIQSGSLVIGVHSHPKRKIIRKIGANIHYERVYLPIRPAVAIGVVSWWSPQPSLKQKELKKFDKLFLKKSVQLPIRPVV